VRGTWLGSLEDFYLVHVLNALFLNRALFQDNGDRHVMRPIALIARGKDPSGTTRFAPYFRDTL
jgi:hypothetical protein